MAKPTFNKRKGPVPQKAGKPAGKSFKPKHKKNKLFSHAKFKNSKRKGTGSEVGSHDSTNIKSYGNKEKPKQLKNPKYEMQNRHKRRGTWMDGSSEAEGAGTDPSDGSMKNFNAKLAPKRKQNFSGQRKKDFGAKNDHQMGEKSVQLGNNGAEEENQSGNERLKQKLPAKERREAKKQKKDRPENHAKLMSIYESLRVKKKGAAVQKSSQIDEVINIVKDKQSEVLFKHDSVRVLEMCVKFGNEDQRRKIFELWIANSLNLVKSKYAKFLVKKFMEYGTKAQKQKIIESFYGNVKKLIRHKDAAVIIDEIYDKYASASQRMALVEEFYGPEFAVFKETTGRTLDEIFAKEPSKKASVIKYMKESFDVLCQKDVIVHSTIHRALFDFFRFADDAQKKAIIEVLKDNIVHILHTKDGSRVAMNCLWHGSTKDRKSIVKSFKGFVVKICKEEFGHHVMLALFDVIDDTVLVKKALFPELYPSMKELIMDQYGRKVLLYLLSPRNKSFFLPELVRILESGDGNASSKKESSVRQRELRDAVLTELLKGMMDHTAEILKNKSACQVLLCALDHSNASSSSAAIMDKICQVASVEWTDDKQDHPINDGSGHWVLKRLAQQDKMRRERGDTLLFGDRLCSAMSEGRFLEWTNTNRGAFVLVSLIENGSESVVERVKADLKRFETSGIDDSHAGQGFECLRKLLGR